MKKNLSILMGLTLIVLFTLTWYSSCKTEKLFTAQINAFNQSAPVLMKIDLQKYQRKLFISNAETTVSFQGKEGIRFNHQIRHFVWGIKMVTILNPESALAEEIATKVPLDQLQITTDISLRGASSSKFKLPQFSYQDDSGTLEMAGFSGRWNFNGDLTKGEFFCQLDDLQLQQPGQNELNLANLRISSQMTVLHSLLLGNSDFKLEKLQLVRQGESAIEFQNIQYQGQTDLNQEVFSSRAELRFAQLLLAEETLSDGRLKLILSGIDAKLLRSLQKTAEQLQLKALNQQRNPFELQLQLLGLYTELLDSGITLTVEDLSLTSVNGEVNGNGMLTLLQDSVSGDSFFSLEKIKGSFHLDVDHGAFVTGYRLFNNLQATSGNYQNPSVLAEQAEQIVGGLVQKGLFTRQDENKFFVDFSWTEGHGTLNGEAIQLK